MPLSLTTRTHAMVASLRDDIHPARQRHLQQDRHAVRGEPDSKSTDFLSRIRKSSIVSGLRPELLLGDIYLNHKYTLEDLMASATPTR